MLMEGNGEEETPVLSCRSLPQKMDCQFLAALSGKSSISFCVSATCVTAADKE